MMKESKEQPTVSVIIPTYNRKAVLMRAVESALSQTLSDIEVLIADDGSTDRTEELFAACKDPRVQYHVLPHRGACAARNAGLALARGQYIAFLDSDDVWMPNKLELQKHQLETSGADVVFCAFRRHDGTGVSCFPGPDTPEGQISYQQLLGGNLVSTQTLFGRAECMKRIRFDERFPRMQDWEYAIRLAKSSRLFYFSDVLAELFVQSDSISRKPELGLKAIQLLFRKYRRDFARSMPNTLLMLNTMETFANQCGERYAAEYLRALSIRRSRQENKFLLHKGVSLMLQDLHLHLTRKET